MIRWITLIAVLSIVTGSYVALRQPNWIAQAGETTAPIDITAGLKEPISLQTGTSALVALGHTGGTGFFWRARSENPEVATATYLDSRSEKTRPETVGASESDIFRIEGINPGSADIRFQLGRVGSSSIRQQTISIRVVPKT
jgi:predicted secreted protein